MVARGNGIDHIDISPLWQRADYALARGLMDAAVGWRSGRQKIEKIP
jgi:hypothetical protein